MRLSKIKVPLKDFKSKVKVEREADYAVEDSKASRKKMKEDISQLK
jgi:hypothetical protein